MPKTSKSNHGSNQSGGGDKKKKGKAAGGQKQAKAGGSKRSKTNANGEKGINVLYKSDKISSVNWKTWSKQFSFRGGAKPHVTISKNGRTDSEHRAYANAVAKVLNALSPEQMKALDKEEVNKCINKTAEGVTALKRLVNAIATESVEVVLSERRTVTQDKNDTDAYKLDNGLAETIFTNEVAVLLCELDKTSAKMKMIEDASVSAEYKVLRKYRAAVKQKVDELIKELLKNTLKSLARSDPTTKALIQCALKLHVLSTAHASPNNIDSVLEASILPLEHGRSPLTQQLVETVNKAVSERMKTNYKSMLAASIAKDHVDQSKVVFDQSNPLVQKLIKTLEWAQSRLKDRDHTEKSQKRETKRKEAHAKAEQELAEFTGSSEDRAELQKEVRVAHAATNAGKHALKRAVNGIPARDRVKKAVGTAQNLYIAQTDNVSGTTRAIGKAFSAGVESGHSDEKIAKTILALAGLSDEEIAKRLARSA